MAVPLNAAQDFDISNVLGASRVLIMLKSVLNSCDGYRHAVVGHRHAANGSTAALFVAVQLAGRDIDVASGLKRSFSDLDDGSRASACSKARR